MKDMVKKRIKKGFIVHASYVVKEKPYIILLVRTEREKSGLYQLVFEYYPYFYVPTLIDSPLIIDSKKTNIRAMDTGEPLYRVTLRDPKNVPLLRKKFEEMNIPTYEADIRFVNRFMIDHGLTTLLFFEEKGESEISLYPCRSIYADIKSAKETEKSISMNNLRVLSLDIETDNSGNLLCASIYAPDHEQSIILGKKVNDSKVINVESEKEFLERLFKMIKDYDPDILTGWNFIDFDLRILRDKAKKHKVNFDFSRDGKGVDLRIMKSFFKVSSAKAGGIMIIDGIQLLRDAYIDLEDYKLETAAQQFLKKGKLIKGSARGKVIEKYYEDEPEKLLEYNLNDARLVYEILQKSKALDIAIEKSIITGLTLDRVGGNISAMDSLYLRELRKRGFAAPTTLYKEKERPITGGYVKEPLPGIYVNTVVLDFKSLYPSIILTFNIDPLSHNLALLDSKSLLYSPNGTPFLRDEEGVLPVIISRIWKRRQIAKNEGNKLRSYALKIIMNSMFGALANPSCRYFNLKIADSITSFGRSIIKHTAEFIERKGYKVIYSDTDSVFIDTGIHAYERAVKFGKSIVKEINEHYKKWVREHYKRESYLELEFEKVYEKLIFFKTRKGREGAKKRYAGIIHGNLDIVGLEAVRSDWTPLARNFQRELLLRVFNNEDIDSFIARYIGDLKKGKYDSLLVYKKALRKPLESYTKTTPPHVKAARMLKRLDTNIIEYVITVNGPEPVSKRIHPIDYDHYVEKQLKPIAESILNVINKKFYTSQRTLSNF